MTTNLQMGISYCIGKANGKEAPICMGDVLGPDYNKYDIAYGSTIHGKAYYLHKNLGTGNSSLLAAIDDGFRLGQIAHIIEEVVSYDINKID